MLEVDTSYMDKAVVEAENAYTSFSGVGGPVKPDSDGWNDKLFFRKTNVAETWASGWGPFAPGIETKRKWLFDNINLEDESKAVENLVGFHKPISDKVNRKITEPA